MNVVCGVKNVVAVKNSNRSLKLKLAVSVTAALTLLGLGFGFFGGPQEFAAKSLQPIYSLPGNAKTLPLLSEGIRDPDIFRHKPETQGDAAALMEEIKEFQSDLSRAKGSHKGELHSNAYKAYVALGYFYEDISNGRIKDEGTVSSARKNLPKIRRAAIKHARSFAKYSKNKRAKATGLFHAYSLEYLQGKKSAAVKGLTKVQKQGLGSKLSRRAQLLINLYTIDYQGNSKKAVAAKNLSRLISALPSAGSMTARLSLARYYAGLNRNGSKARNADKRYRSFLYGATKRSSSYSSKEKSEILGFSVAVWRKAEGRSINWSKSPILLSQFGNSDSVKGIVERGALADWKSGKRTNAIKKYKTLAKNSSGTIKRGALDLRSLDLERLGYLKSKNTTSYERALKVAGEDYLDPGLLGDGNESKAKAMSAEIKNRYRNLAMGELKRVQKKSAKRAERRRAVKLGSNYMATLDNPKKIEEIKAKIASIYVLDKQYAAAVSLFRDLAETNVSGKKSYYYKQAIAAQTVLADWSLSLSWQRSSTKNPAAREELLGLYKSFESTLGKKHDWYTSAQIGLLSLSLDQKDAAFSKWNRSIKRSPRHPNAGFASGIMLNDYEKSGQWSNLESLARLCRSKKISASFKGKKLDTRALLALSLLEGGKDAIANSKFQVAVKKLEEFVKSFKKAKNYDEGFYKLATAYRGNSQNKKAIETLVSFTGSYSKSRYYKSALLNGGDWSVAMAYEENALTFYDKFIEKFSQDPQAQRVKGELVSLYLGREIYSSAIKILSSTNNEADFVQALELEDRHGSESRANALANKILKKKLSEAAHAEAYAVKVRTAAQKDDYRGLKALHKKIASLGGSTSESQEALGEVRYFIALADSKNVIQPYYNLELKDPRSLLNKRYSVYSKVKNTYLSVCEAGGTSYCAPAMNKLSNLSMNFLGSLEDLQVQSELSKKVVAGFEKRKQDILNTLTSVSQRADQKALGTIAEGNTDPNTTQAVLWNNASDWNFERVSGETGNGYVQWSANQTVAE